MSDDPVFLYAAVYADDESAHADYETLLDAHAAGLVGTYDAALIVKDENGKVHVHKHEKPTQHGAWTGIGVGALVGILFPPSIIGSAIVAGTAGGVIGHLRGGMSRKDVKELGEDLQEGQTALLVIGQSRVREQLEKSLTRAQKIVERQIDADAKTLKQELEKEAASTG
jgi:uncharacterized membrane protein